MIIIVSTGALLLLFYMISKGSVNKVSSLFYFIPAVTMLFDYIIFQTPMPLLTIFGSFIIIISVMTYTRTQ
ncbi:EamA family transporter [Vibrio salinus]|uniref:EamA family transporter n=1 Tax=Vibrio salinus TaxID=2899784 RepID=UPI001E5E38F5|nr:EamA family transporter [Vibrio salinus]